MLSTQNRIQLIQLIQEMYWSCLEVQMTQLIQEEMLWSCLEVQVTQLIQKEMLWSFLEEQAQRGKWTRTKQIPIR